MVRINIRLDRPGDTGSRSELVEVTLTLLGVLESCVFRGSVAYPAQDLGPTTLL
jgi:hypothetical protein